AGADAVHPGYGFLAENAGFAAAVEAAGMIWIGPPPAAIEAMGDKVSARRVATAAGVSSVPGSAEPITSPDEIEKFAAEYGWPVALKAAHGGGGRGFRVVHKAGESAQAFEGAGREAQVAFGNPELYLERYLEKPRHVEVQVFGDAFGNLIHLGERDCSLQRRHQKLVEESPSPAVDEKLRAEMGEAAVRVAREAGYWSAGTVEFLLETTDTGPRFWFLEMNTRLQVEHPVTELVTGIDLAKLMIKIADGEELPLSQDDVVLRGHAIECRINAENPAKKFMPNPGRITEYLEPNGPGVRVDSGVIAGSEIAQSYDSLLGKLICYGQDRDEAIERTVRALDEFHVVGLRTTIPFFKTAIAADWFRAGNFSTSTVENEMDLSSISSEPDSSARIRPASAGDGGETLTRNVTVELDGKRFDVRFSERQDPRRSRTKPKPPDLSRAAGQSGTGETITASMQGTIVKILFDIGKPVKAGEAVIVLEAMKMENLLLCHRDGVLKELKVKPGDTVTAGTTLAVIESEPT
ncbi:MAG TPA: biotin/lipoyl-containing protein, partial [Actinomycetota bacterium]|nr:biotin/lipoyl-containing protein [Actinomycetota bacterium]